MKIKMAFLNYWKTTARPQCRDLPPWQDTSQQMTVTLQDPHNLLTEHCMELKVES